MNKHLVNVPLERIVSHITKDEHDSLRLQYAISNQGRGGRRYLPYVFTEHGVAMLSSVLKSNHAVQLNISIVRAFIKLREILSTNIELARKIEDLENVQKNQNKHINTIYSIIEKLITSPPKSGKSIGFEK